jgi:Domain of unknown function (DUF4385)
MDVARKFPQMGYTRSPRSANHKSGRKYTKDSKIILPREEDPIKADAMWQLVKTAIQTI